MPDTVTDLLECLAGSPDGRPRLVGVDGFSGSGKTTLAAALAGRPGVTVVSIEQFYRGWSGLEAGVRQARRELVDAVVEGRAPVVTPWDWLRDREGPPTRLHLGPIVVLEGCGAGAALLRAHQDLTVWVDAGTAERDRRLRARPDWADYAPHRRDFERQEQRLAARERTRAHADVVVSVRPDGGFDLVGTPAPVTRSVASASVSTPPAPDPARPGRPGPDHAGPDHAGPDRAGHGSAAPGTAAPGTAAPGTAAPGTGRPTPPLGAPGDDAEAWSELAAWKGRVLAEDSSLLGYLGGGLSGARESLMAGLRAVPGVAQLDDAVHVALHQLAAAGAGAGANTVRRETIFARFRAHGFAVKDFKDIRELDVRDVQAVLPRLDVGYVVFAGVQGGLTSFLTSSGAAAAAGGAGAVGLGSVPGVATVAASLAGDAVLTVAACTRAVAHVGAYYGYDVSKRSERVLALAVLAVGLSSEADAPEAYEEVASLVRTRAQDKERRKRQQRQLQRLAKAVHQRLLSQIGQRELAQLVPVVGIGIGAVLSARLLAHVVDAAEHLYRERFLHDKYDIPFGTSDELEESHGVNGEAGTVTTLPRTQLL